MQLTILSKEEALGTSTKELKQHVELKLYRIGQVLVNCLEWNQKWTDFKKALLSVHSTPLGLF